MIGKLATLAAALSAVACAGADIEPKAPPAAPFADGQSQVAVQANQLEFRPCSAKLPSGCEMAVVQGSPGSASAYTLRFRSATPLSIVPHSHPSSERITVLKGTVYVGEGDDGDKTQAKAFGPGDFYMHAPGAVHYLWTEGPIELQVTGVGPREFHLARDRQVP